MKRSRFLLHRNIFLLLLCLFIGVLPLPGFVSGATADNMNVVPDDAIIPDNDNLELSSLGGRCSGRNTGVQTSFVVPFQARVSVCSARLRVCASAHSGLIDTLPAGQCVTVIGQTTGSDKKVWYKVQYCTYCGYIRYDQLEVLCGTAQLGGCTDPTGLCIGQTNTRAVNVRLGMSTSTERVRLLRRGQQVTLLGLCRDVYGVPWYYVCIPSGAIGFIRGEYITVIRGVIVESVSCLSGTASPCQPVISNPCSPGISPSCSNAWVSSYPTYVSPSGITGTVNPCAANVSSSCVNGRTAQNPSSDFPASCYARAENNCQPDNHQSIDEELLYLRWMSANMSEINQIGEGYQGYSLYDLDGDGIRELLISCCGAGNTLWQIYTCDGENIIDLGQLAADGYYLPGKGSGFLLVYVLSDSQTQYYRMLKVGNSMVTMFTLLRTADEAWQYSWTYNQKLISDESLRMLLSDFSDDVLQNMGLYHGSDEIQLNSKADMNK